MLDIKQAIEVRASGTSQQLHAHVESGRDRYQRPERDLVDRAALDARDDAPRNPGGRSQVCLPPPAADPGGSNHGAEPQSVHANEFGRRRSRAAQRNTCSIYCRQGALVVHNPTGRVDNQERHVDERPTAVETGPTSVDRLWEQ